MNGMNSMKEVFEATKVVAIIRGMAPEICVKLTQAYQAGGIRLVEVTFDQVGDPEDTVTAIKAIKEALNPQLAKGSAHPEVVKGGDDLLYTILAVGYKLDKSANLADGTEIYSASAGKPPAQGPMLTPKFCTYYGLNNFKDAENE